MASGFNSYWTRLSQKANATVNIVCLPYAGGNYSAFRSWPEQLPDHIDVVGVQLPGRGTRLAEHPISDLQQLVRELAAAIVPLFERTCVLFGHSLGALLAFEVSRRLRHTRRVQPRALIVSGRRAPQLPRTEMLLHDLNDRDFVARLVELNGTPPEILASPEMLAFLLPILRADFKLG